MKTRETIKKVLPFLGVGAILAGGITSLAVTNASSNQNTQVINKANNNIIIKDNMQNDYLASIDSYDKEIEPTIKGQEIVSAINAFELSKDVSDTKNIYVFDTINDDSEYSLLRDVQQEVKYISKEDMSVQTIPSNSIDISYNEDSMVWNVSIDMTELNGFVTYYNFNSYSSSYENNPLIANGGTIRFNAMSLESSSLQEESEPFSLSKILMIAGGIVFGSLLILAIVLFIKRRSSNKYVKCRI